MRERWTWARRGEWAPRRESIGWGKGGGEGVTRVAGARQTQPSLYDWRQTGDGHREKRRLQGRERRTWDEECLLRGWVFSQGSIGPRRTEPGGAAERERETEREGGSRERRERERETEREGGRETHLEAKIVDRGWGG